MSHIQMGWTEYPPDDFRYGAVTVGNFDGVHLGHQALVAGAKEWSAKIGGPAIVVTFDPPPLSILHPDSAKPPLTTIEDRAQLLLDHGADRVITIRTEPGLLAISPEAFFEDVICRQLAAKALVEGADFRFGRKRTGDVSLLKKFCESELIDFEIIPPVVINGESVSSSRVRNALIAGDIRTATTLLGHPYSIRGTVATGAKRGRTLGFPTANLENVETLVPAVGVYAMKAFVNGQAWPAAANIGPNPTFGEDARKFEIHIIGFSGDLYGTALKAEFITKIRDTVPFSGVDALKEQLQKDVLSARQYFSNE